MSQSCERCSGAASGSSGARSPATPPRACARRSSSALDLTRAVGSNSTMSVLMTLRIPADADALERAVEQNRELFLGIAERAKGRGAIHHDFYAAGGEVVVVDEWESPEAFQGFFEDEGQNIGQLMAAAGVQGQPGPPAFYSKLSLGDQF